MIVLCHRSWRLDVDSMSIAGEHPNEFTRLWEGNNSADRRLRLASGVAASHVEQTYATPRRFDVDRGTIDFLHGDEPDSIVPCALDRTRKSRRSGATPGPVVTEIETIDH